YKYESPAAKMAGYLDRLAGMKYMGPPPPEKPLTVIGALGPKMLEVAARHCDGAHPYNVTPKHTAFARAIIGADKLLCTEQMVLLESDAETARAIGRKAL